MPFQLVEQLADVAVVGEVNVAGQRIPGVALAPVATLAAKLAQHQGKRDIRHRALHPHRRRAGLRSWCVEELVQVLIHGPCAWTFGHFEIESLEEFDRAVEVRNMMSDCRQPKHVGHLSEERLRCQNRNRNCA